MSELSSQLNARQIAQELSQAYRDVAEAALRAAEQVAELDEFCDDRAYRRAIVRDIKVDSAHRRLEDARELFHDEFTRLRQIRQLLSLYDRS